jgi:hypothetical protein
MNRYQLLICSLVLWSVILIPLCVHAGETTFVPALSLGARYDNNVLFDRTIVIDDYSSVVHPSLALNHKTERTDLNLGADVKFVNYLDETDLDNTKQVYEFNVNSQLSERLSGQAEARYIRDTLLDSELEETGVVYNQEDRERINTQGGVNYSLSQKSRLGALYSFTYTDYEEETRADRNDHSVGVTYSRFFNDGLDSLSVSPRYRYILLADYKDSGDNTVKGSEAHNFSLNIGWTHKSSEVGTIRLFLGGRYTEERPADDGNGTDDEKRDYSGVVADFSYTIKDEISNLRIGYRRDINYDADNDLREVDRLYAYYHYLLTERSRAGIDANIYLTRTENQDSDDSDTRYLDIQPKISYSLTEQHYLQLAFRYSLQYDDTEEDETIDRSQLLLAVVFRFPQKY